jgi:hypothetical protein
VAVLAIRPFQVNAGNGNQDAGVTGGSMWQSTFWPCHPDAQVRILCFRIPTSDCGLWRLRSLGSTALFLHQFVSYNYILSATLRSVRSPQARLSCGQKFPTITAETRQRWKNSQ